MTEPTQPHDKLFKGLLDQPGAAGALIRERLPKEIAALLDDSPPELQEGEFVDEVLRGSQSDRLYLAKLKDGRDLLLYILIDHKSYPDLGVILQLLGYMARIWLRHAGGRVDALRSLPPILPIVVYHGASEWKVSLSLRDMIAAPDAIKHYQPDVRYILADLGPIPNDQLSAYPPLRAGLLALKYSHRDGDTESVLIQAFTDAREFPSLFSMLVVYATTVYPDVNPPLLRSVIRKVRPEWEEQMLSIAAKEWMAEGRAEGKAEGMAEGLAESLLEILEARFGSVDANRRSQIAAMKAEALRPLIKLAATAPTVEAVFAGVPLH